jgi:hypothetical protein
MVDGNSSLKRMKKSCAYDYRQHDNPELRIPASTVDHHEEGEPTADKNDHCINDFAATNGDKKLVVRHLDETGIVTLFCRHGFAWRHDDKIQSGEA